MCSSVRRRCSIDATVEETFVTGNDSTVPHASTLETTELTGATVASPPSTTACSNSKRLRGLDGFRQRAAALCLRRTSNDEEWEILLVSGRTGKDYWVLPGGGLEKEESAEEAVIREFREEAGVQGAIVAPIGEFTDEERCHRTALFLTSVTEMYDDWEDFRTGRKRRWMGASETLQKIKKNQAAMVETSLRIATEILKKQQPT